MRNYIKTIGKESTIYSFSNILNKAIGFLLIPLYTKFLSPEQYGIITIVSALIGLISAFYSFGMISTWSRFYFDFKDYSKDQKEFLGNIFIFITLYGGCLSLLLTFFSNGLFNKIAPGVSFIPFIMLSIWSAFLINYYNLQLEIFRIRGQAFKYAVYSLTKFIGLVILTIIAIAVYKFGAIGKVASEFIIIALAAMIAITKLLSDIKLSIQLNMIKQALLYAIPIFFHQISWLTHVIADKFFLVSTKGLSITGVYNIAFQFGSVMSLIVGAIHLSWYPFFMNLVKQKVDTVKPVISRLITYYFIAILLIGLAIVFFCNEAIWVLTSSEYYGSIQLIPIFVLGFLFQGLYLIEATALYYNKKFTRYLPLISFISAIINIGLNYYFIPKYGSIGAAIVSATTMIVLYYLTLFFSNRAYRLIYERKRIAKLVSLAIILTTAKFIIHSLEVNYLIILSAKIMLIALFPLYVLKSKFLTVSELTNFNDIIKKLKKRYLHG